MICQRQPERWWWRRQRPGPGGGFGICGRGGSRSDSDALALAGGQALASGTVGSVGAASLRQPGGRRRNGYVSPRSGPRAIKHGRHGSRRPGAAGLTRIGDGAAGAAGRCRGGGQAA